MREKIKTGISIFIILILLPYVAVVFRTGNMRGEQREADTPSLEDYVAGILPGQMPVSYPQEALKSQAVIIRTNLLKKSMEFYGTENMEEAAASIRQSDLKTMGFSYASPEDLEKLWGYGQWEDYYAKVQEAVTATQGQILVMNAQPVDLPYHAVSAGRTRSGQVLGEGYSHLEPVECPQDVESADYLKIEFLKLEELPEILSQDDAGYVTELRLGGEVLGGEEFRSRYSLNSSCFSLEKTQEGIRAVTKGLGHGLGLSMYQASQQAAAGKTYMEILLYFYKNVECISFH
ncbi:putative protein [Lachnospiraceae bacterium]|nr:putative protein [Lachnospiraceae bacterium]